MHLTGWAAERLKEMTPEGFEAVVHVTLTDDFPWAQAFVVIEARPLDSPTAAMVGLTPSRRPRM
jgi:holo-[acyl-carrier protein] synthase